MGGTYDEAIGVSSFDGGADGYGEVSIEEVAAPGSEGVREERYAVVESDEMWIGTRIVNRQGRRRQSL